jgi:hypothetical protein
MSASRLECATSPEEQGTAMNKAPRTDGTVKGHGATGESSPPSAAKIPTMTSKMMRRLSGGVFRSRRRIRRPTGGACRHRALSGSHQSAPVPTMVASRISTARQAISSASRSIRRDETASSSIICARWRSAIDFDHRRSGSTRSSNMGDADISPHPAPVMDGDA